MSVTTIPFMGFYDSVHSINFDDYEAQEIENINETHNISNDEISHFIWTNANYKAMHVDYARAFVDQFCARLENESGFKIELKFESLSSPREYNFTTDRIFCTISENETMRLFEAVKTSHLNAACRERFTTQSGFTSFYDPDFTTWGHVTTWDHNQIETLLVALITEHVEDWLDIERGIAAHDMNEIIQVTFDKNCDLSKLYAHDE